jgi:hypothetical protein
VRVVDRPQPILGCLSSDLTAHNNCRRYNPVSRFLCLPELEDADKRYLRTAIAAARTGDESVPTLPN